MNGKLTNFIDRSKYQLNFIALVEIIAGIDIET